jgi:hypothetical protein
MEQMYGLRWCGFKVQLGTARILKFTPGLVMGFNLKDQEAKKKVDTTPLKLQKAPRPQTHTLDELGFKFECRFGIV